MKKHFYLAAAALLSMAATVNAQDIVISEDMELTDPASWGTHFEGARDVTIAGATVTFANEGMNTTAFHPFHVDTVRLYNGAKIVMFDSPDTWYPNPDEDPSLDVFGAAEFDDGNGSMMTEVGYRFKIMGDATIVCDSKCTLGGKVMSEDGVESTLTLIVGDSTKINIDFMGFTGTLKLQYREEAKNQTVLFGTSFPSATTADLRGHASGCTGQYNNMSSKCYCSIPWSLEVPDGCLLKADDMISLPRVFGRFSVYAPRTILLRPSVDHVYEIINMEGGNPDNTGLHFELFPGETVTINGPINWQGRYVYARNRGVWINSQEPTFSNMQNEVSVRQSNNGFVGGNGILGCGIACKDGTTSHIYPGAALGLIGELRVQGDVYMYRNNSLDVEIGGGGRHDRLTVEGEGTCYVSGTNTRIWMELTEDFYKNPVAGNYKVMNASKFVDNTVYFTDTTGTRFKDLAVEIQDAIVDSVLTDSVLTFPNSTKTFDELKDSLKGAWANMFEQFQDPTKKHRDTLFYHITKIDTTGSEVSQAIEWMTNTREDGTRCDSLPEGYSWYPLEWNQTYASIKDTNEVAFNDTIAAHLKALRETNFFTKGVIALYGPGYEEDKIVNRPADEPNSIEAAILNGEKTVVSSCIYTEDGKAVGGYVKGVNILRTVYSDGTVTTTKVYSEGD